MGNSPVFFDLRLNKRLSKQPWGWWFETPSWSLWRQCIDIEKKHTNRDVGFVLHTSQSVKATWNSISVMPIYVYNSVRQMWCIAPIHFNVNMEQLLQMIKNRTLVRVFWRIWYCFNPKKTAYVGSLWIFFRRCPEFSGLNQTAIFPSHCPANTQVTFEWFQEPYNVDWTGQNIPEQELINVRAPFYQNGSTSIPAGISNHMVRNVFDEII